VDNVCVIKNSFFLTEAFGGLGQNGEVSRTAVLACATVMGLPRGCGVI
jgi:hypothetical protein